MFYLHVIYKSTPIHIRRKSQFAFIMILAYKIGVLFKVAWQHTKLSRIYNGKKITVIILSLLILSHSVEILKTLI